MSNLDYGLNKIVLKIGFLRATLSPFIIHVVNYLNILK